MRIHVVILVVLTTAISLLACSADKPAEVPLPSGTEAQADEACENLRKIGCPEGFGSVGGESCLGVLVNASKLRPLPLACWAHAKTGADAKGCGSLRCIR